LTRRSEQMPISDFDHYTVRSKDHDASWRFYEKALGLTVRKREGAPVPAFKVSIGEREVVHVFQAAPEMEAVFAKLPPSGDLQGWNTGRLHHVEFWASGLGEMKQRLAQENVSFVERTLPDKHQVQMYDPDGIAVNLNFQLSEAGG
jgi:catechol 2,3-dioxygenase-like lactoylglutathione lyase family enzyme